MPQFDQNIIEKFGREKLPTGWPWRFFTISVILLGISLVIYLGLTFGYRGFLNNQLGKKDQEINQLAASIPKEDQAQLMKFYSQLQNLKSILDQHVLGSKTLPFLEKTTNKKVFYNKLDLDVRQRSLNLDGIAESYEILAQQLEAFNQAPEVERFLINNSQLTQGAVRFSLSVILKPEMFK